MGEYTAALAAADRLVKRKGGLVSASRPTGGRGPYDVTKPWKPDSTSEADTVLAVGLHAILLDAAEVRGDASNPQVLQPSVTAVFYLSPVETAAAGVTKFLPGDVVTDARGVAYLVVEHQPYTPGDVTVLETLHVRSG
jgi:hypothetical protein